MELVIIFYNFPDLPFTEDNIWTIIIIRTYVLFIIVPWGVEKVMFTDNIKRYKHIIWDWNGTLLDDVDVVIDAMNSLLKKRDLPLFDIEKYKDIFTFPVKEYYARLGFDFSEEPFEDLALEFVTKFNSEKHRFKLHVGVEEVLRFIESMGMSQSILSASQEEELNVAVDSMNIKGYFLKIAGLHNHYAVSKAERGIELIRDLELNPKDVLLIGDTVHDHEVAEGMGCECLLVCNGHQSSRRLSGCSAGIVDTVIDVVDFIIVENLLCTFFLPQNKYERVVNRI